MKTNKHNNHGKCHIFQKHCFVHVYLISCLHHRLLCHQKHSCVIIVPAVCRGTDDVFQALEDNQVILSTMKVSRFVRAFEMEVDRWERRLSVMLEVIEMILTVQRHWIYLEVQSARTMHTCEDLLCGSPPVWVIA